MFPPDPSSPDGIAQSPADLLQHSGIPGKNCREFSIRQITPFRYHRSPALSGGIGRHAPHSPPISSADCMIIIKKSSRFLRKCNTLQFQLFQTRKTFTIAPADSQRGGNQTGYRPSRRKTKRLATVKFALPSKREQRRVKKQRQPSFLI